MSRKRVIIVLAASLTLAVGTAMLAAPGQDRPGPPPPGTERPGQLTRGLVFIENRTRSEAIPIAAPDPIPVVVQNISPSTNTSLPVRLAGSTPGAPPPPLAVRQQPQAWEYRTLTVPGDVVAQGLTSMLSGPGNEGWEPAGIQVASGGGTLLVLKRPRS